MSEKAWRLPLLLSALLSFTGSALGSEPLCTRTEPELPLPLMLDWAKIADIQEIDLDRDGENEIVALVDEDGYRWSEALGGRCAVLRLEFLPGPRVEATELFRLEALAGWYYDFRLVPGDVDGDGLVDLMVGRSSSSSSGQKRLDLYLQVEPGSFSAGPPLIPAARVSVSGDYDGDGRDEVVVLRDGAAWLHSLSSEGGWQLDETVSSGRSYTAVSADVDADGDDDLITLDASPWRLWRFYGDPDNPLVVKQISYMPYGAPIGDLELLDGDGEGPPEIVAGEFLRWPAWAVRLHGLRVGEHATPVEELWSLTAPRRMRSWRAWDFDDDGRDDLSFGYQFTSSFTTPNSNSLSYPPREGVSLHAYFGQGEEAPRPGPRTIGAPNLVLLRDLTGDGILDAIVRGAPTDQGLTWYRGLEPGRFEEPERYTPSPHAESSAYHLADLNADGTTDLISQASVGRGYLRPMVGLGDGRFVADDDVSMPWVVSSVFVHDIDSDGIDDVIALSDDTFPQNNISTHVAYGRGDGSLEPFVDKLRPSARFPFFTMVFGDLDGDGDDDFIGDDIDGGAWIPVYVEGRRWTRGRFELSLWDHDELRLLDLDGDGLDDVVYEHRGPRPERRRHLAWRRSLPEGGLGAQRELLRYESSESRLTAVDVADLDNDGTGDLFVQFARTARQDTRVLQGRGGGRFRSLWEGEVPVPIGDRLADFDGDGTLDIVSDAPGIHYWPGDGSGRFRLERGGAWYAEPRALLADFTGDGGLDVLTKFMITYDNVLGLSFQESRAREADLEPPTVEIWMRPLAEDLALPPEFDGEWRVVTTVHDACDASPRILTRRLDLEAFAPAPSVAYRAAERNEIRIYEHPEAGSSAVVLAGPDESELRDLFASAQASGGFPIDRVASLRLQASDSWGASPRPWGDDALVPSAYRLVHRFSFESGGLSGASVTRPGGDLTFTALAEDHLAKRSEARASLRKAQSEYCARPDALDVVCGAE